MPSSGSEPVSLPDYLERINVSGEQVDPNTLTDLTVSMPTPAGWSPLDNPNYSPGTIAIAKDGTYPMAMLMVFKLTGDFNAADVVSHGFADAELSQNFTCLKSSTADFDGFPSAMIQGSYDHLDKRLHTFNRVVVATGSPPAHQRYLVQFTITSLAEQAACEAADIEAIMAGFTVAAK